MDKLIDVITYLFLISVAAERFTDIIKKAYLERHNVNGSVYQLMTFIFGAMLAYYNPISLSIFDSNIYVFSVLIGLCVSGSSSVWHEILELLNNLKKNIKVESK